MLRVNGFPLFRLAFNLGAVSNRLTQDGSDEDIRRTLIDCREPLEFGIGTDSVLPADSKSQAAIILNLVRPLLDNPTTPLTTLIRNQIGAAIFQLWTVLAVDLAKFDLYWITPKLGYSTPTLMEDATIIFPESIKAALPAPIKYEIQQAANCLLYEAYSAVGFHVLRAVELVVLNYFTIPKWKRGDANNWVGYAKVLRKHKVHRKIVAMIERLATLHRNELMHAEAVLLVEEAAMLFAMMQEVLPIMIADVAKKKGIPIAKFPILDDSRWQDEADKELEIEGPEKKTEELAKAKS